MMPGFEEYECGVGGNELDKELGNDSGMQAFHL
jgi:hypothetical protein